MNILKDFETRAKVKNINYSKKKAPLIEPSILEVLLSCVNAQRRPSALNQRRKDSRLLVVELQLTAGPLPDRKRENERARARNDDVGDDGEEEHGGAHVTRGNPFSDSPRDEYKGFALSARSKLLTRESCSVAAASDARALAP